MKKKLSFKTPTNHEMRINQNGKSNTLLAFAAVSDDNSGRCLTESVTTEDKATGIVFRQHTGKIAASGSYGIAYFVNSLSITGKHSASWKKMIDSDYKKEALFVVKLEIIMKKQKTPTHKYIIREGFKEYLNHAYIQSKVYTPRFSYRRGISFPESPNFTRILLGVLYDKLFKIEGDKPFDESPYSEFYKFLSKLIKENKIFVRQNQGEGVDEKTRIINGWETIRKDCWMSLAVTEYSGDILMKHYIKRSSKISSSTDYSQYTKLNPIHIRLSQLSLIFQLIHILNVMSQVGFVHMDLKSNNLLTQHVDEMKKHCYIHTNGLDPLYVLEMSEIIAQNKRVVIHPFTSDGSSSTVNMYRYEDRIIMKVIDFGLSINNALKKTHACGDVLEDIVSMNPGNDMYKQYNRRYNSFERPPEQFEITSKQTKEVNRNYAIGDVFAAGIYIFMSCFGTTFKNFETAITVKFTKFTKKQTFVPSSDDWKKSFTEHPIKDTDSTTRKIYMLLHAVIRHVIIVCMKEIKTEREYSEIDTKKNVQYFNTCLERIEREYSEPNTKGDYGPKGDFKKFMPNVLLESKIRFTQGGVFTKSEYDNKSELNTYGGAYKITKKGEKVVKGIPKSDILKVKANKSRLIKNWAIMMNGKTRLKRILGRRGLVTLFYMIYPDPLKRLTASQILREECVEDGLFGHMIVPYSEVEERIRDNLEKKGTYDLRSSGIYKSGVDTLRPYSLSKMGKEERIMYV